MPLQAINPNAKRFLELRNQVLYLIKSLNLANHAIEAIESEINPLDLCEDHLLDYTILRRLHDLFVEIEWELKQMQKPIKAMGKLYLNSQGRYAMSDDIYFTCGDPIEVYLFDDNLGKYRWIRTSVEARNGRYYLVGYPKIEMNGLLARIRG